MVASHDRVQLMRRLPGEDERPLPGQRPGDEPGLPAKAEADVVGDDDERPALGDTRQASRGGRERSGERRRLGGHGVEPAEDRVTLFAHGVFATRRPAK